MLSLANSPKPVWVPRKTWCGNAQARVYKPPRTRSLDTRRAPTTRQLWGQSPPPGAQSGRNRTLGSRPCSDVRSAARPSGACLVQATAVAAGRLSAFPPAFPPPHTSAYLQPLPQEAAGSTGAPSLQLPDAGPATRPPAPASARDRRVSEVRGGDVRGHGKVARAQRVLDKGPRARGERKTPRRPVVPGCSRHPRPPGSPQRTGDVL